MAIGVLVAVAIVVRALAHRVRRNAAILADAERRFRTAFEDAAPGMTLGRFDGTWIRVNRAFATFLGHDDAAELRGFSLRDVTHPDELDRAYEALARMAAARSTPIGRAPLHRAGTAPSSPADLAATVIRDDDGVPRHYIAHVQDISDRKPAEAELAHRAGHDPLTGLPNRALLIDRLAGALARLARRGGGSRSCSSTSTASSSSTTPSATTPATSS